MKDARIINNQLHVAANFPTYKFDIQAMRKLQVVGVSRPLSAAGCFGLKGVPVFYEYTMVQLPTRSAALQSMKNACLITEQAKRTPYTSIQTLQGVAFHAERMQPCIPNAQLSLAPASNDFKC